MSERGAATLLKEYEAGRLPGENFTEWKARNKADPPAPPAAKPAKPKAAKPTKASSTKRKKRAPRTVREAGRRLQAPVRDQAVSGLYVAGLSLGVVALYLLLTTAEQLPDAVKGAANGPAKALRWLSDPSTSIRYAPGYTP